MFMSNQKFIEYLQKLVIKVADDSDSCTIEGLLGMNILAMAFDSKNGAKMTERVFLPDSLELQKIKKIFL